MNPKELTLDVSKWRCGGKGQNKLGKGITFLLNYEGFSCCLGQWGGQLGISDEYLLNVGEPIDFDEAVDVPDLFNNNSFVSDAIEINDDKKTTPGEKITLLTNLCEQSGIKLNVINQR